MPKSQAGWYDIGGAGGDVVVTGGSIRLSAPGKFQCNGGTAYGDLTKKTRVFVTTVNLSGEKIKHEMADGTTKEELIENHAITDWELSIGGQKIRIWCTVFL